MFLLINLYWLEPISQRWHAQTYKNNLHIFTLEPTIIVFSQKNGENFGERPSSSPINTDLLSLLINNHTFVRDIE